MDTDIDKKIDGLAGRISKLETGMDSIRKELHQATYFMAGLIVSIWAVTLLTCIAVFTLADGRNPPPINHHQRRSRLFPAPLGGAVFNG